MQDPGTQLPEYLETLIHRLLYTKGLNEQLKIIKDWETPDKIKTLELGSLFFRLVKFSFTRTLLMELCLLFDTREKRGIHKFLDQALIHHKQTEPKVFDASIGKRVKLNYKEYKKIIENQLNKIVSLKDSIKDLTVMRDKIFAHTDKAYLNIPIESYMRISLSPEEIEKLISLATDILRIHHVHLFNADIFIELKSNGNVDRVLRYTRAFDRVKKEKRLLGFKLYKHLQDDNESESIN